MTTRRKQTDQTIREQVIQHLEALQVPMSTEQVDQAIADADKDQLSRLAFLERFLSIPANRRRERSVERRLRLARFRDPSTLESFDWNFNKATINRLQFDELATGDFIRRRDNLVFVGESGLGKSHLIQSIGRRCCSLGYRIRYTTSAELMEDLTAASGDKTLPRRVRYYSRFDLLIIDEFGFEKLERREYPEAPSLLYKVIDSRSQRGSTALVTNVSFDAWTDYLGDPPLAMALLDRVVDGAIIQPFQGKSYRAHRAKKAAASNGNGARKARG